ncbi:hypothetical protein DFH09DRAFT_1051140 [Mycena vulgaris]|nr:hypothetical protein DFH09DRAFT_1051140 [Mycena vulgaris]
MIDNSVRDTKTKKPNGPSSSHFRIPKTGFLPKLLISMPIDVLFEIFGYLHPYDVLRLTRVTKPLRRLLLDKSASGVWRTARENLAGIPEKPSDLSEPAWIHLLFEPQCHFCWTKGCRVIEWRLRVRICGKCAKIQIQTSSVKTPTTLAPEGALIESILPRILGKKGNFKYLNRDHEIVAAKYSVIKSSEDQQAFVTERRELIKQIDLHAERCEEWAKAKVSDRTREIEEIRKERQAAIIEKLINLGYEDDVNRMEYPQNLKYLEEFTRPQALTERVWKNIRGPVEAYMKQSREARLARLMFSERSKPIIRLFQQYKNSHLPYTEIMPGPVDICKFKRIKTILNSPADVSISESSFSDVVPAFEALAKAWRRDVHLRLLHQVNRVEDTEDRMSFLVGYDEDDEKNDFDAKSLKQFEDNVPAKLNQIVFVCDNCTPPLWDSIGIDPLYFERESAEPLYYPEVLDHRCLTRSMSHQPRTQSTDTLKHLEHYDRDRGSWNCRILSVEKSLGRIFTAVVTLAGQNPVCTSAVDMDQLDMWFACMNPDCLTPRAAGGTVDWVQAFKWRHAVKHQAEHHPADVVDFEPMTSYEADFSRSRLRPLADLVEPPKDWLCAHCRDLPMEQPPASIGAVQEHLKSQHNILSAQLNQDYYQRFGTPLRPAFGKGPVGEDLSVFGDIPQLKIGIA